MTVACAKVVTLYIKRNYEIQYVLGGRANNLLMNVICEGIWKTKDDPWVFGLSKWVDIINLYCDGEVKGERGLRVNTGINGTIDVLYILAKSTKYIILQTSAWGKLNLNHTNCLRFINLIMVLVQNKRKIS